MKSYFVTIVGFLVILILLSIMIHVIKIKKDKSKYVMYDSNFIRSKLRTGDIILFASTKYNNIFDKISYTARTTFLGANYGHLGLVYREGDDIYIVESTNINHIGESKALLLNKYNKGGIRMISYDILMEKYSRHCRGTFSVRFIEKPISNKKFMSALNNYKDVTFPKPYKLVLLLFIELFISKTFAIFLSSKILDPNEMMCGSFVYNILHDCNVLEEYPEKLFWPYKVSKNNFEDIQLVKYSKFYRYSLN